MKNTKYICKIRKSLFLVAWGLLIFSGCVDNNETAPPELSFQSGEIVTVQQIKDLYADELAKDWTLRVPVQILDNIAVKGIVTASDKKDGNLYKEAYIQDASGGLHLLFNSTSGLYTGDSVIVNLKEMYISDYGNLIQVGSTPYTDDSGNKRLMGMVMDQVAMKTSINNPTFPEVVTLPQLKAVSYIGKLVTISGIQFIDSDVGKPYADWNLDPPASANRYLMDCSKNQVIVRSSGYASFADDTIPELNGSITGIVTVFNSDYQLIIRDFDELQLTEERCTPGVADLGTPVETITQDFSSFANNSDIAIDGWQNIGQVGDRVWRAKFYSGNTYAQATGYGSGLTQMVTWLISRPVTITDQKVLTFRSAKAYWAHTGSNVPLQVFYSTNYTGKNIMTATWVPVTVALASKTDADYAWINSGSVNLPVESGKSCVIAFKYTGSSTESTSSIIDDILITTAK